MNDPLIRHPRRGPIELKPRQADDFALSGEDEGAPKLRGSPRLGVTFRDPPTSGPANPIQRVGNAFRTAEPVVDLRQTPNLTGTYFESGGRYRLFVNHVGKHLECLLTLVVQAFTYANPGKTLAEDVRIPFDWGVCSDKRKRRGPIAFRFAGDDVGGSNYELAVPKWIGEYEPGRHAEQSGVGILRVLDDRTVELSLSEVFRGRWPEHGDLASSRAVRASSAPVLLDRYLAHDAVPTQVRTRFWFGTTPVQHKHLPGFAWRILTSTVTVDDAFRPSSEPGYRVVNLPDLLYAGRQLTREPLDRILRDNLVRAINAIVKDVFNHPLQTPLAQGGISASHHEELRYLVFKVLNEQMLEARDGLPAETVLSALQRTLDHVSEDSTDLRGIERYLGLIGRRFKQHELDIKVEVFELIEFESKRSKARYDEVRTAGKKFLDWAQEASEKAGGKGSFGRALRVRKTFKKATKYLPMTYIVGFVTVEYRPPAGAERPQDSGWSAQYGILLAGLKVAKTLRDSPTVKLEGKGYCHSASPPRPEDLEGVAAYLRADAFAGFYAKGVDARSGGSKAVLLLYGDTDHGVPVHLELSGDLEAGKAGAGVQLLTLGGYLWLMGKEGGDIRWMPDDPGDVSKFATYWADRVGQLGVLFPINGARLSVPTQEEEFFMHQTGRISVREALNAFTACELPLIANPTTKIAITGQADRPDTPERNKDLSKHRAESVCNYLKSLVGELLSFGLEEENLRERLDVKGIGEPPAKPGEEHLKETFDPEFRRVDVVVQDRTVYSEDEKDGEKNGKKDDTEDGPDEAKPEPRPEFQTKFPLRQPSFNSPR